MKGLIATLLALMMTGMVVSQQPQSNNFQSLGDNTDSTKLLGKYLLVMGDELINGLKTQGHLSANISDDDRTRIDHIVFHSSESNSLQTNLEPFHIQPIPPMDGDKSLVFELNDHYIELMQRKGLRYIIQPQDRGRFTTVTVTYDRASNQLASRPAVNSNQSSNEVRNFNRALTDNNQRQQQPFIGPQLPADWDFRNQTRAQDQNNNDSFRPRLGSIATRRNSTITDNINDPTRPNSQNFRTNIPQNRDFPSTQQLSRLQDRLAIRDGRYDASQVPYGTNRVAANTPFESNARFNSNDLRFPNQNVGPQSPPRTNDLTINRSQQSDPMFQQLRQRNAENQTLADENEELRRQLNSERMAQRRNDAIRARQSQKNLNPDSYGYDSNYGNDLGNQSSSMPDRVALAPRPTNKVLPFSIPANNSPASKTGGKTPLTIDEKVLADSERFQKQNAALWFIMLCSVGLNFYLSWIARGFYVRYEELADEIRETFTSSM